MPWWTPSGPIGIQPIPWLHPDVISYLDNLLTPNMEVLEFGAGGSTLWFAERVKSVVSYERNRRWFEAVVRKAPGNVLVIHPYHHEPMERPQSFDLILIDGDPVGARAAWIKAAEVIVRRGGWIVLDNANRNEYAKERRRLQTICAKCESFDRNEAATDYLVTDFYKMKGGE